MAFLVSLPEDKQHTNQSVETLDDSFRTISATAITTTKQHLKLMTTYVTMKVSPSPVFLIPSASVVLLLTEFLDSDRVPGLRHFSANSHQHHTADILVLLGRSCLPWAVEEGSDAHFIRPGCS